MSHPRLELDTDHFRTALARDVGRMIVGDFLGAGIHRQVYTYGPDPKRWVVKLEDGYASFANHREWEVWRHVVGTEFEKWFAPLKDISGNGILLIQARTQPIEEKDMPSHVPAFFTDIKAANWGRYKGRIVCHDYANHLLFTKGMTSRMRKAEW